MAKNTTPFLIVKAELTDAGRLSEISHLAKSFWGYPEEWLTRWKSELQIEPGYILENAVYKLIENQQIIGFCAILSFEKYYEIAHLWIVPDKMGKGLGSQLLETTIKMEVKKALPIRVTSDPNAKGFYEKHGFNQIDEIESYPPGRLLPLMERLL